MLIDFFEDLIDSEIRIQKLREEFTKEYELSPYEQYLKLKFPDVEYCDRNGMINYLQKFDFIKGPMEVDLIFSRFDKNLDGRFYFTDVNFNYYFFSFFLFFSYFLLNFLFLFIYFSF
jgi:hypothetical protein